MHVKLQVHAAADEVFLQHAAAPRRSVNPRRYGFGTEHRMPGNPRLVRILADDGINAILRFDLEDRPRRYAMQVDAALDLRLDHVAVDIVAQMRIRRKHIREFRVSVGICVEGRQSLNSPTLILRQTRLPGGAETYGSPARLTPWLTQR